MTRYGARVLMKSLDFWLVALPSLPWGSVRLRLSLALSMACSSRLTPTRSPPRFGLLEIRDLKNPRNSRGFYRMGLRGDKTASSIRRSHGNQSGQSSTHRQSRPKTSSPSRSPPTHFSFWASRRRGDAPFSLQISNPMDKPERVIVLTYKAWQRLFDASPAALGQDADAQRSTVHRDRRDAAALRLVDERGQVDRDAPKMPATTPTWPRSSVYAASRRVWENSSCRRS